MEQNLERPAFPSYHGLSWKDGRLGEFHGMTLRDYFAAKVLQGLAADPTTIDHFKTPEQTCAFCYKYADQMLKAREQ